MFLHLGVDTVIPLKDVIVITDLKSTRSAVNRNFLNNMREKRLVVDVSSEPAKSCVITDKYIYLSAISSVTLKKRAGYHFDIDGEDD